MIEDSNGYNLVLRTDASGNLVVNVGSSDLGLESEQFKEVAGSLGTNDNDTVYESADVSMYGLFTFECTVGAVDVFVQESSAGTYGANPVAMIDLHSTTPATRVVVCAADKKYCVVGHYYKIKVLQNGATGANIIGNHSNGPAPA